VTGVLGKTAEFRRRLVRSCQYLDRLGFASAWPFIVGELFNRVRVRQVSLSGENLHLRTGTSDLYVAADSLLDGEFRDIFHPRPRIIVDAGANIGTSSIFFARNFPEARVFAIEPARENYELLLKNVAGHGNIVPVKAALWDSTCQKVLRDRHTGPWGYTLAEGGDTASTGQLVECKSLPQFMREQDIPSIDILKIDIEGGEKVLFESSAEWISRVDVISIELHDRIVMGCSRAFYLATRDFACFAQSGEKVIAYRLPFSPEPGPGSA